MLAGLTLRCACHTPAVWSCGPTCRSNPLFTSIPAYWSLELERGGQIQDELVHTSQHHSLPVSLCAGRLWSARGLLILTSMVANVDVKLLFAEYNGVPGPEARRDFKKNCIQKLGQPDKFGCSIVDTLLRMDMGAVVRGTGVTVGGVFVPGVPSPNAMPWPPGGGNAAAAATLVETRRARVGRLKNSASSVCLHFTDEQVNPNDWGWLDDPERWGRGV